MNPIPMPHFSAVTTQEQLHQLQRSLVRLIEELNMILPMLEKGENDRVDHES